MRDGSPDCVSDHVHTRISFDKIALRPRVRRRERKTILRVLSSPCRSGSKRHTSCSPSLTMLELLFYSGGTLYAVLALLLELWGQGPE